MESKLVKAKNLHLVAFLLNLNFFLATFFMKSTIDWVHFKLCLFVWLSNGYSISFFFFLLLESRISSPCRSRCCYFNLQRNRYPMWGLFQHVHIYFTFPYKIHPNNKIYSSVDAGAHVWTVTSFFAVLCFACLLSSCVSYSPSMVNVK